MAKNQADFFKDKKPWSQVKDDLLACYLVPYFQKIVFTGKPVRYIDCFAGRGDFDDGKQGSPLIALDAARRSMSQSEYARKIDIRLTFIETLFSAQLEKTASTHEQNHSTRIPFQVIPGRFEDETPALVTKMTACNLFLYIDPYNIRNLNHELITSFAALDLNTIELLMNFNSFGFIRAACQALKVRYDDDGTLNDIDTDLGDEIDIDTADGNMLSDRLTSIAGGDYWQETICAYRRKDIDGHEAERQFSENYRNKLNETFRFVVSMPIRLAPHHQPKYRMIYATNHAKACSMMADNMRSRADNLYHYLPGHSQGSLFDEGLEGDIVDQSVITERMRALTSSIQDFTDIDEVKAKFYTREGVLCKTGVLNQAFRTLEQTGWLEFRRTPEHTANGQVSTRYTTDTEHQVWLRATSTRRPNRP